MYLYIVLILFIQKQAEFMALRIMLLYQLHLTGNQLIVFHYIARADLDGQVIIITNNYEQTRLPTLAPPV